MGNYYIVINGRYDVPLKKKLKKLIISGWRQKTLRIYVNGGDDILLYYVHKKEMNMDFLNGINVIEATSSKNENLAMLLPEYYFIKTEDPRLHQLEDLLSKFKKDEDYFAYEVCR